MAPNESTKSTDPVIADAVKLLKRVTGECRDGLSDHAWRRCERCLALHEIQNHQFLAMRLLHAAIDALEGKR